MINKLMNSRVTWRENDRDFELIVSGGHVISHVGLCLDG